MTRHSRATTLAVLSLLWCGASASAETMRCQSVNGNVNCAGSGAVSCQTINGKKVCVSGHGDVVQSFGNGATSDPSDAATEAEGWDDMPSGPVMKQRFQQYDRRGHTMLLDRDGSQLHLRTDKLSIDRD